MTTRRAFLKACGLFLGTVGLGKAALAEAPKRRRARVEVDGVTTLTAKLPPALNEKMMREAINRLFANQKRPTYMYVNADLVRHMKAAGYYR